MRKYPQGVIIKGRKRPTKTRKKFPIFQLPEVALDLDAENSPHVRPFNNWDVIQQQAEWGYDPAGDTVLSRVSDLRKHIARDDKLMLHQASRPDILHSISDYDVLAMALFGGSVVSASIRNLQLANLHSQGYRPITFRSLRTNGIPERVLDGDANRVISFMLHRLQLARNKEDAGGDEAFNKAIRHSKYLGQLRKLCFGRRGLSHASIDHIVHTLQSMPSQPPEDVLKFINNLTIRQLSEDAGLNASMSLYGLEISSKINLLPSIVQYSQICLSGGFFGNDDPGEQLLGIVGHGLLTALEQDQGTARGTRPGLFTLLTGKSLASPAQQAALFGLEVFQKQKDPEVHKLYVRLLAELGAPRLLWHARREFQEEIDITAFIRCVEVLSSAKGDASVDCTTVTGDPGKDADLDLRTINSLDAYHTSPPSVEAPYPRNIEGLISSVEVKQVFGSTDIHQALARLDELISRATVATQPE